MTKEKLLDSFYYFDAFYSVFNTIFLDINPKDKRKVELLTEQLHRVNAEYVLFKKNIEQFCEEKKRIKAIDKPVGDFARISQLSKMFGMGVSTLWAFAKKGKITPIKISNGITVFNVEEVKKAFNIY
ncbi:helix-turn-helix transcriptional regulator [Aliarcobacter lanthieri]|uniref:helix-turn-helix transcriptional regulator n=1 Tax=Aliarcobacter lanthieri TaxID=1355374 RepID=UPI003AAC81BF